MKNKTLLIIGGTDGIGKEIAIKAGKNNSVIIVGRSAEKGRQLLKQYPNWYFYRADVSEMLNVKKLAETIGNNHSKIDFIVHTADVLLNKRIETSEGLEKSIALNFYARVLLNHLLINEHQLMPSRFVHIALAGAPMGHNSFMKDFPVKADVSSANGHMIGQVANDMYGIFLQRELGNKVKVNILNPGMVDTDIRRNGELPFIMKIFMPFFALMRPFIETKPNEYANIPFSILEGKNDIANNHVLISPKGKNAKESKVVSDANNQRVIMSHVEKTLISLANIKGWTRNK